MLLTTGCGHPVSIDAKTVLAEVEVEVTGTGDHLYESASTVGITTTASGTKDKASFRNYSGATDRVSTFYALNHQHQTVAFNLAKRAEYFGLNRSEMGVWEAMEYLQTLVDDSDPDTRASQMQHNLQTAEAIRLAGHPRWFQLVGLIHDLGKILSSWGEPQWAVVGDTFPVGVAYSSHIVYFEFLRANPDFGHEVYSSPLGIYTAGCGIDHLLLSWGHDEYLYQVTKEYLPPPAQAMIRYHSFYPWHTHGAYSEFMTAKDHETLSWVRLFQPFDLYSKDQPLLDVQALRPYYEDLISEFFPAKIRW
eukprot:gb/GEZN01010088.1/.p1 GENE.gb/GEZN01010088.1/~~gb/GEZN01010088.1/.p1  ORF type:complete len:330 (+),score=35.65 gb/GEZN01010088.1/:73-990(+)